jgi:sulfate adenylyltransferase large subunit
MNVHPRGGELALDARSPSHEQKSLLRFVACGSVDHGKSTLIGRLLYESKQLLADQLDALTADSRKFGTQGEGLDFSLLLDGLAAEREQRITIDVAHRFFATARRKFIVIDAPGHEQYTANMATGASVADLALVLVGADEGLTRQTKRHVVILSMLGIRSVVLVVNKMDRVGWSKDNFRSLEAAFREFAGVLGMSDITCIPVAAASGDNVVSHSPQMPWYRGATLLDYLEEVEPVRPAEGTPFRMPIQWVNRPNPSFRGYSGLITSGAVHVGMPVTILPSRRTSRIARIVTHDGDLVRAECGRSITLTFADQIDASRGDVVAAVEQPPQVADRIGARVFWMNGTPLQAGQTYLMKLATRTVKASVHTPLNVIDLDTRRTIGAEAIAANEIGTCVLQFERPLAVDRYVECRDTGSFILIDPETCDTVGMGCVEQIISSSPRRSWLAFPKLARKREQPAEARLGRWSESHTRSLAKAVSWRATGSIDTFMVALLITRNFKIAGSVALTEVVTKIVIYYCHERLWALVPWGKG